MSEKTTKTSKFFWLLKVVVNHKLYTLMSVQYFLQ
jgi:hypothetical protein